MIKGKQKLIYFGDVIYIDDSLKTVKKTPLCFAKLREIGRQERKWIDGIKEIIGLSFKSS